LVIIKTTELEISLIVNVILFEDGILFFYLFESTKVMLCNRSESTNMGIQVD